VHNRFTFPFSFFFHFFLLSLTRVAGLLHPDGVVGTDSHTTMCNGLGVFGWGVVCFLFAYLPVCLLAFVLFDCLTFICVLVCMLARAESCRSIDLVYSPPLTARTDKENTTVMFLSFVLGRYRGPLCHAWPACGHATP
jgi:hypothetical protein